MASAPPPPGGNAKAWWGKVREKTVKQETAKNEGPQQARAGGTKNDSSQQQATKDKRAGLGSKKASFFGAIVTALQGEKGDEDVEARAHAEGLTEGLLAESEQTPQKAERTDPGNRKRSPRNQGSPRNISQNIQWSTVREADDGDAVGQQLQSKEEDGAAGPQAGAKLKLDLQDQQGGDGERTTREESDVHVVPVVEARVSPRFLKKVAGATSPTVTGPDPATDQLLEDQAVPVVGNEESTSPPAAVPPHATVRHAEPSIPEGQDSLQSEESRETALEKLSFQPTKERTKTGNLQETYSRAVSYRFEEVSSSALPMQALSEERKQELKKEWSEWQLAATDRNGTCLIAQHKETIDRLKKKLAGEEKSSIGSDDTEANASWRQSVDAIIARSKLSPGVKRVSDDSAMGTPTVNFVYSCWATPPSPLVSFLPNVGPFRGGSVITLLMQGFPSDATIDTLEVGKTVVEVTQRGSYARFLLPPCPVSSSGAVTAVDVSLTVSGQTYLVKDALHYLAIDSSAASASSEKVGEGLIAECIKCNSNGAGSGDLHLPDQLTLLSGPPQRLLAWRRRWMCFSAAESTFRYRAMHKNVSCGSDMHVQLRYYGASPFIMLASRGIRKEVFVRGSSDAETLLWLEIIVAGARSAAPLEGPLVPIRKEVLHQLEWVPAF